MRADNSHHLAAAARRRAERTRERAVTALRRMDATGKPITLDALAREAAVSRSWLYAQDDLRAQIERLRQRHRHRTPSAAVPDRQRATDASLLRRLEATAERLRHLEDENRRLRDALARALGERRLADILGHPTGPDTPTRRTPKLTRPR
jgi:hypothetical protein